MDVAFRNRREAISSSVRTCHSVYSTTGGNKQEAMDAAFEHLDMKKNGRLDRSELMIFLEEAARHVQLEVNIENEIIELAVDALVEDARQSNNNNNKRNRTENNGNENSLADTKNDAASDGDDDDVYITREEFYDIFERHPDMLRVFEDSQTFAALQESVRNSSREAGQELLELEQRENEQVWEHAHVHWKNRKVAIVWLLIYLMGNTAAITYKAMLYNRREEAQAVFGTCISVARGAAQALNLNACLVLFPICRHFSTALRATRLRFLFPFDASLEIHVLIGIVFALLSTAHICAHMCDFYRFARADEDDIYALFGDKLGPIPESIRDRWKLLLRQPAGITGVIMTLCLIVAYVCIYFRRTAFNRFWFAHHLLLVMLIALCFHGMSSLLEPFQSIYWLIPPFTLYFFPRVFRETNCTSAKVMGVSMKQGDICILKLEKKGTLWSHVQSGMYAFINIPALSCVEWHPFTLTSAPHESHIEFAIKNAGDWTAGAHSLLKDADTEGNDEAYPTVKVEGPIGASSQGFSDYPVVVLIGAGIGATPMISVVKHLLRNPGKMKLTFFYWTVRDRSSFEWFSSVLDDIYEQDDNKRIIHVRHFLTSLKEDDRDLGAVLLHHAARSKHRGTDFDLFLGRRTHHQVEVGRPDWNEELRAVRDEAREIGVNDCGIFLCGPEAMAQAVDKSSFELSREDRDFHFYFTKETF